MNGCFRVERNQDIADFPGPLADHDEMLHVFCRVRLVSPLDKPGSITARWAEDLEHLRLTPSLDRTQQEHRKTNAHEYSGTGSVVHEVLLPRLVGRAEVAPEGVCSPVGLENQALRCPVATFQNR